MPTYDYECDDCYHTFELFQGINDKPVRKCPACGKSRARRLVGAGVGLIFKGSGFYITDYRKGAQKSETDGGTKPAAAKTASTKTTESKKN